MRLRSSGGLLHVSAPFRLCVPLARTVFTLGLTGRKSGITRPHGQSAADTEGESAPTVHTLPRRAASFQTLVVTFPTKHHVLEIFLVAGTGLHAGFPLPLPMSGAGRSLHAVLSFSFS